MSVEWCSVVKGLELAWASPCCKVMLWVISPGRPGRVDKREVMDELASEDENEYGEFWRPELGRYIDALVGILRGLRLYVCKCPSKRVMSCRKSKHSRRI